MNWSAFAQVVLVGFGLVLIAIGLALLAVKWADWCTWHFNSEATAFTVWMVTVLGLVICGAGAYVGFTA